MLARQNEITMTNPKLLHLGILGAIAGDVIGSVFEWERIKTKSFDLFSPATDFTDDSVMTIACAEVLLHKGEYADAYRRWGNAYPGRGYGGMFARWLMQDETGPYNSFGNGSAMRVSPVGFAFTTLEETLKEAKRSAEVTHNHPEGIKGAQATACAIFLARTGSTKEQIHKTISDRFHYDLTRTVDSIRPAYSFNETCQLTVPEAIIAFLDSTDYEDAIRNAVSLGGDSDTLACITGGIAAAFYRSIPEEIAARTTRLLPKDMIDILQECAQAFSTTR
jgi:ADP-ribosyl-[dinitrogen reductase] hydrolase